MIATIPAQMNQIIGRIVASDGTMPDTGISSVKGTESPPRCTGP